MSSSELMRSVSSFIQLFEVLQFATSPIFLTHDETRNAMRVLVSDVQHLDMNPLQLTSTKVVALLKRVVGVVQDSDVNYNLLVAGLLMAEELLRTLIEPDVVLSRMVDELLFSTLPYARDMNAHILALYE